MTNPSTHDLTSQVRGLTKALGFAHVGIAPAVTPTGYHRLLEWLQQGYAGEMAWMDRRRDAYQHPDGVMRGTRSVIMVAMNYFDGTQPAPGVRISRYAQGSGDYHSVLKPRLQQIAALIRSQVPLARSRVVIDTAPLLERDFGRLAGIGWFGKNTMLISRSIGSWFFLGAILTDVELDYDAPETQSYCGSCTRCLDACPTDAFPEPGVLDASRCISYLTIELRNASIPEPLRDGIGPWLFGCDVCQDVCPWNRFAPEETLPEFQRRIETESLDCEELLTLDESGFQTRFGQTPLARPGRSGLLRNACIVLGNLGDPTAIPSLQKAALDPDPLIKCAAEWALHRLILQECCPDLVSAIRPIDVQDISRGAAGNAEKTAGNE
jgi:epoxyqueuosine reductase